VGLEELSWPRYAIKGERGARGPLGGSLGLVITLRGGERREGSPWASWTSLGPVMPVRGEEGRRHVPAWPCQEGGEGGEKRRREPPPSLPPSQRTRRRESPPPPFSSSLPSVRKRPRVLSSSPLLFPEKVPKSTPPPSPPLFP